MKWRKRRKGNSTSKKEIKWHRKKKDIRPKKQGRKMNEDEAGGAAETKGRTEGERTKKRKEKQATNKRGKQEKRKIKEQEKQKKKKRKKQCEKCE